MQTSMLFPVTSRPTVDFIEALAAAAGTMIPPYAGSAITNLYGVPPIGSRRFLIRAIAYECVQNVGLEFDFFSSAVGGFLARFEFQSANGAEYNGLGNYLYYVDGLAIPYLDADSVNSATVAPTLHVGIQNIDTVAKGAGELGAITATFWLEPMTAVQG